MVTQEVGVVEHAFLKWTDVYILCDKEALFLVNSYQIHVYSGICA